MTIFPEISRRARDKYHNLQDDDIMKNIFNSGRHKDKVGMQIPAWMINEEKKHTEHYRMYTKVFGINVPLTQSQPTESTQGTHRTPSAPRSPNPSKEAAESSAPRRSTVIRLRILERRSARLTPPAPVPNVDKADEKIIQDTLQVSLAEHKSHEEQEARENVALVDEHLASEEIDKMVEGQENVVDDSSIPRNDESNIPGTRIEPRSDKESPEVEIAKEKEVEISKEKEVELTKETEVEITQETPVVNITNVVIPVNVNDENEEITDEVYELKRREKGKIMVDSFCESFYIPAEVHPTAPGRDKTIAQFQPDSTPHLTARQEQTVKLLESHKDPFRWYLECFLCLVGLSPYYPFDENSYPDFERPDGTDMGLLDFIKTADPQKVRAVKVQKGEEQVKLLESTQHWFLPLKIRASEGSSSTADAEVPAPAGEGLEDAAAEDAYLELADPGEDMTVVRQGEEEVAMKQPKKTKRKRLVKQGEVLPAKKLRTDHPSLASGTGGKTLVGLEQIMSAGSRLLAREYSSTLSALVDTAAATTTSTKAKLAADVNPDLAGPSQLEESEGSDDSFYELATFDPSKAKRAARQICLGSEVRSRAEHELELKEKLNAKYAARGKLLEEKDSEILRLKSQMAKKEAEAAEVIRLRNQVSSLSGEKSTLTAEVSALKVTITQKDNDISLLDSRATHLASSLDDAKVSSLRAGFQDFKEKMEVQQEEQAQELYNRVAELEAHVMDVSGRLEGEFYPTYLTLLAGRMWLLTHGIQLALLKCLKSSEYQGILGHDLGRAVDFGMQEGLETGYEHGVASAYYVNAVKALEDAHFPLVDMLKSKKDAGMDEVLDCFLLDGTLAELPEAASLQPHIKQLSIPIHHAGDKTAIGETSISFALMNVHARDEGARKHVAALRQPMMEIVSAPLSSQTWVGEASISAAPLSVEDYAEEDTYEALGSVVAAPYLERCCL
ncbi:hypothetical protein Tco_0637178 [Tanacetum coccineum]